jgi:suppressor of fused
MLDGQRMSDGADDSVPGWDAITAALEPLYKGKEPKHYGTIIKWSLGGPDPLDGISAWKRTEGGGCHWHIVTYGLTELYQKESPDPEVSGYGFELTFRLGCAPDEEEPPVWAMNFLQNLARYVFQTGNGFAAGHHMTLNGPIALEQETGITAVIFAADPELPPTKSPFGSIEFLQVVGITEGELEAVQAWNSTPFTELLRAHNPLLVTDLGRKSMLTDPKTAQTIAERTEKEGSSMGTLFVSSLHWERSGLFTKKTRLKLAAMAVSSFVKQLRGRLLHQRPLRLLGKGGKPENFIELLPAETANIAISAEGGHLVLTVPPAVALQVSGGLQVKRGIYRFDLLADFEIEVVPTEIKDSDGKVLRVVG